MKASIILSLFFITIQCKPKPHVWTEGEIREFDSMHKIGEFRDTSAPKMTIEEIQLLVKQDDAIQMARRVVLEQLIKNPLECEIENISAKRSKDRWICAGSGVSKNDFGVIKAFSFYVELQYMGSGSQWQILSKTIN